MIKTDRCILRLPKNGEGALTLAFYNENKEHFSPWDPKKPADFYTTEFWEKKITDALGEFEENKSLRLNVYLDDNETLVGKLNFTGFERGPFQCCRLGYQISKKFEGKGYMTESLKAAIDYLFNELNFHRIEANYIVNNEKSGRLLKRLGFVEHGIAKEYLLIDGRWQDHVLTSITNNNWKEPNE